MVFLFTFLLSLHSYARFSCEAKYDSLQIPHLETNSLEQFYYCFGFHHGQDRAWQMDFFRRVAQGRNAEVYGLSHLKGDLMMRLLDLPKLADRLWKDFPSEKKKWMEIYAEGVNKGFEKGKGAQEFLDLNYSPDPWLPEHSILVLVLQSFDQTRKTFFRDYEEEKSKEAWGKKAPELFNEDGMPWENTILKEGEYRKKETVGQANIYRPFQGKIWEPFPTLFGEESGSNNWVVSAKKSSTGHALLANDPHLDLKTPLFWYWIHLRAPGTEVIGGSVPGIPIVASGTNGKVAWGLTNAYINTADSVFIKDPPAGFIETFRPNVKVKVGPFMVPFFLKSFERTKTGSPVIPLEIESRHKMVLKWSGFSLKVEDILPMFELFHVKNVTEMNETLKGVGLPSWNFVFADTQGEIGFRVVGKTYRHTEKTPFGIPVQSVEEFIHDDFLDPNDRPNVLRPKRQYVYTANNRHWPEDAYFYGGRGYSYSFRGNRIDELLQGPQNVESMKRIQCDQQVVDAKYFVPKIQKHIRVPEFEGWNFEATGSNSITSVYRRLMDVMMEEWKVNEYALFKMLDTLSESQKKDLERFYARAHREIQRKSWDELHRLGFPHLAKWDKWVFSPEIPGVGDTHTVNPGTGKWNSVRGVYEQASGASMRMIIEMKPRPVIHLGLPGLNRNYTSKTSNSAWEKWRSCAFETVQF